MEDVRRLSVPVIMKHYRTSHEYIRFWAQNEADLPALVGEGMPPLSYRGLVDMIDLVGRSLNESGLGRGDRIAIVHPEGRNMAAALVSIMNNATAVPCNPDSTLGEFSLQFRDMRVNAVAIAIGMDTPAREAAAGLSLPIFDIHPDGNGSIHLVSPIQGHGALSARQGSAEPDDIAVLLATSGTTSQSKIVPLRQRNLAARNTNQARTLGLTTDDRCLNAMRLFHSGGIGRGLTTTLVSGGSVAFLTESSISGIFDTLENEKATWMGGSYAHYHAIHPHLKTYGEAIDRISLRLRFLSSGTGALNPSLAADVEKTFNVPIVVVFGSSESGNIAGDSPNDIRTDKASTGKRVHSGVAILDDQGLELPDGETGEIVVKGDQVIDGYENDDAANRLAYCGEWFRLGDLGHFNEDGYLYITGRIKELINRGGEKVSPNEIDDTLLEHNDIVAAATFPVPHPTLGEDVAVAVVPADDANLDDVAIMSYLRERLSEQKMPRRLFITDEIPKGPTGKVQRHKLADHFCAPGDAEVDRSDDYGPATPLEAQLQALWAASLGRDHVGLHEDYFQLGGDSLQAVELFLSIEKTLGQPLPRSILFEASTVAEMAERIGSTSNARCVVPIQPNGSRPPLFCVHDVNGNVLNFRVLAAYLGTEQPVYGVQSVGLDGSEAPLTQIEDMAARYVTELRAVQPFGPYCLCGYSMGGWIAYEMAQQLKKAGQHVAFLGLFDTSSRQGPQRASLVQWLGHHVTAMAAIKPSEIIPYIGQRVRNLAEMSRLAVRSRLFRAAQAVGASSDAGSPARIADANSYASRVYNIRPYDGDAVLFKATRYAWTHPDAHKGWYGLIGGRFETVPIPGTHGDILEEPNVPALATALSHCLDPRQADQIRANAA
jgi:acyl-CoA synthetase (AMP-forming)/AMP-acid ligase II/thioesterase domain-containing protein/acyl carrier protein